MTRRMSRNGEPGRNRPRQGEAEGRSRVADFSGRAMTRRMSRNGEPGRNRTFNQQIKSRWQSQGTSSQVVTFRTNRGLLVAADHARYGRSATRCHTARLEGEKRDMRMASVAGPRTATGELVALELVVDYMEVITSISSKPDRDTCADVAPKFSRSGCVIRCVLMPG
jgi:hypothetical protein